MFARSAPIVLGLAWLAAAVGVVCLAVAADMLLVHVPLRLMHGDFVLKGLAALSVISAVLGVVRARTHAVIGAGWALGWGALGAVYGTATARLMLINMNPPIPFYVYAPNYAEAAFVLLIGLTGAILCLVAASLRRPATD
jgi:hypothetical protein